MLYITEQWKQESTGSQQEAMDTANAKNDMQRQGKKYGNLHNKF